MEQTTQDNKLIAEFMGIEHDESGYINNPNSMEYKQDCNFVTHRISEKELQFNSSWDWLMPVVERIERTNLDTIKEVRDTMLGSDITITFSLDNERVYTWIAPNWTLHNIFNTNNRLSNTYYCVVEFIKWYNEQQLNKR